VTIRIPCGSFVVHHASDPLRRLRRQLLLVTKRSLWCTASVCSPAAGNLSARLFFKVFRIGLVLY